MSPSQCRAKAAEVRNIVRDQPDFAETAERIARAWEEAADQMEGLGRMGSLAVVHARHEEPVHASQAP